MAYRDDAAVWNSVLEKVSWPNLAIFFPGADVATAESMNEYDIRFDRRFAFIEYGSSYISHLCSISNGHIDTQA